MIKLGNKVKDVITGFKGVVIGRTEWLHGCTTCGVVPQELKDGTTIDSKWFDEGRLEVVKGKVKTHTENHDKPGGPHIAPTRQSEGC